MSLHLPSLKLLMEMAILDSGCSLCTSQSAGWSFFVLVISKPHSILLLFSFCFSTNTSIFISAMRDANSCIHTCSLSFTLTSLVSVSFLQSTCPIFMADLLYSHFIFLSSMSSKFGNAWKCWWNLQCLKVLLKSPMFESVDHISNVWKCWQYLQCLKVLTRSLMFKVLTRSLMSESD